MSKNRQLCCSFCGRSETEVSKLVAGPRVYICDQCVLLASQIMGGDPGDPDNGAPLPARKSSVWSKLMARARQFWDWNESRLLNA
ncbi:MAG TPA: ClpX C4-type zinc finger protein [Candidatus Competibacter sp.]|nr:hypothetical protein [Candidatus Competibacteraceae bacterium]HRC72765.1 ClpX C4-type zinc finger protein [Candidatus Competibacter sp.]